MGRVVMRNSLLMHQRMHSDCMKFELDILRTEICWLINLLGLDILNHKNIKNKNILIIIYLQKCLLTST